MVITMNEFLFYQGSQGISGAFHRIIMRFYTAIKSAQICSSTIGSAAIFHSKNPTILKVPLSTLIWDSNILKKKNKKINSPLSLPILSKKREQETIGEKANRKKTLLKHSVTLLSQAEQTDQQE